MEYGVEMDDKGRGLILSVGRGQGVILGLAIKC